VLRQLLWAVSACVFFLQPLLAQVPLVPTTTLSAETGKNTSAADSFGGTPNGNIPAGANVSKVPLSTLLYPGATTRIYAHHMPWFGFGNHYDIGYHSDDPAQVKAQVSDMLSRGIGGMIIDWYGQGSNEDKTSLVVKPEAESRGGQFEFAIMDDAGSVSYNGCSDCTSGVITDLTYIYNTYESSPSYMRWNGRPVVFFFGVEGLSVNWSTVSANVPGNPILIFENANSFTRSSSDGAFAWVMPSDATSSDPLALQYLDNFYATALANSGAVPFAAGYKGFDDTIASWSANRHIQQQCGQTWLASMAEIGKYYSASRQLAAFQLVTWNDYEEGTEIETGIDNCLSVSASISGNSVGWTVTGSENTLDHYTVFISSDGQNLMSLGDYGTSTHSLDLSKFGFAAGKYTVYVKAVGKPSIVNHMSGAVSYTASGAPPNPNPVPPSTPDFVLSAAAASASVAKGNTASYTLNLVPTGSSASSVSFTCSGLPDGAACGFSPTTVRLASAAVPVNVSISTSNGVHASNHFNSVIYAMTLPAFGTVWIGFLQIKRKQKLLFALFAGLLLLLVAGCGGGGGSPSNQASTSPVTTIPNGGTPAGSYTVTVTASAGALQHSTTLSLVVQ
jgi:hypothetical protein